MTTKKRFLLSLLIACLGSGVLFPTSKAFAGNEDRAGSAGGTQLLVNPWARNTGWAGANGASIRGLESTFLNVSGLAFTEGTEVRFAHTRWLAGSGISINSAGFAQRVGDTSKMNALSLNVVSMNFGEIPITTTLNPNGGIGTFSPSNVNIGLSYAQGFTRSIYGGFNIKVLSESISDLRAMGVAIDAGIRYITENDKLKFGISLKNVGPPMSFEGNGLSFTSQGPNQGNDLTVEQRSADFEIPSLLNISGSYDFDLGYEDHDLTVAGTFVSNSFTKDQIRAGFQYSFRNMVYLRGGYIYEDGVTDSQNRMTVFTGPTGGLSVDLPLGENTDISFDYSYRATNPYSGTHSIGASVKL